MRYNYSLLLVLISSSVFTSSANTAEQEISAEFLQWYMKYSDENGEVFDPLALQDLSTTTETENLQLDSEQKASGKQASTQQASKRQASKNKELSTNKKPKLAQDGVSKESKTLTQEVTQP